VGAALAASACVFLTVFLPAAANAATATAELRVLTPDQVIDPGSTYVVGPETVATDPNADCNFGGAGGSGAEYSFEQPTALSLLAAAARANGSVRPISVTDEFGFALAICAIGGVDDREGTFWYLKRNHQELTVGADQEPIADGDELLIYLSPDNFPAPNPKELELLAPARARPGDPVTVTVLEHGCVTDPNTFEVSCQTLPAAGATVSGADGPATTGVDGTAEVSFGGPGRPKLTATRGADIPSNIEKICVKPDLGRCPAAEGERIFGRADADRIKGTAGPDKIRARGGRDRVDIRKGGRDRVDCGAGRDTVLVKRSDSDDRIRGNCERIRRR
jgi:hypothetical protein